MLVIQANRSQKFVDELIQQDGILAYGIFAGLPDDDALKCKMITGITKGGESSFAESDKRTRVTRGSLQYNAQMLGRQRNHE